MCFPFHRVDDIEKIIKFGHSPREKYENSESFDNENWEREEAGKLKCNDVSHNILCVLTSYRQSSKPASEDLKIKSEQRLCHE